LSERVQNSN